ncbi:hypothetical protein AVEN_243879-1 [Araneus ventricosus]|uniref:Uncharacterized protein n=1 Tax=Araneus ventricosus TaxID=182803 RepID=A0A4Y2KIA7_ARAVE|nr:hypothetical protein AVEN_243879-1 [Araneus ventricosus]
MLPPCIKREIDFKHWLGVYSGLRVESVPHVNNGTQPNRGYQNRPLNLILKPELGRTNLLSTHVRVYSGTPSWVGRLHFFRTLTMGKVTSPNPTGDTRIDPQVSKQEKSKRLTSAVFDCH